MGDERVAASFRDPSGFVFRRDGELFRQVNERYREDYDLLIISGLYDALLSDGSIVSHEEVDIAPAVADGAYKVIKPEPLPFISYPYEWSFSQLKDAALTTLSIQKRAVEHEMSLKDASAYNIQFLGGSPVLMDTLSFERYREGEPWVAYRQFCKHFLAPLALMSYVDVGLGKLMQTDIDGVELGLASKLLPWRTKMRLSLFMHIHMQAKFEARYSDPAAAAKKAVSTTGRKMSMMSFLGLIDNLEGAVKRLAWKPAGTEWADYYDDTNYSGDALDEKERLVSDFLDKAGEADMIWDLGANTGRFSRIASGKGAFTVAFDIDPAAVEKNYLQCRRENDELLLPLVLDLTNPSPAIGWRNRERETLAERGPADVVLALALIHHLAISNNVPLESVAQFFSEVSRKLIIEFVPKEDSQVERLLATREDIFDNYDEESFEKAFSRFFSIEQKASVEGTERTLYLMNKRNP